MCRKLAATLTLPVSAMLMKAYTSRISSLSMVISSESPNKNAGIHKFIDAVDAGFMEIFAFHFCV
jgi:hypothetical protein